MHQDVVLATFDHARLRIIDLRRDPVRIVTSMARLGWFSAGRQGWEDWFLDPSRPDGPLGLHPADLADPVDRIVAHVAEVVLLRHRLRNTTPAVRWVDVDLPDLASRSGARKLIDDLGLGAPSRRWPGRRLRRPTNERSAMKERLGVRTTEGEVAERLDAFLARFDGLPGLSPLRGELARWRRR